jgi:hypothetical protein
MKKFFLSILVICFYQNAFCVNINNNFSNIVTGDHQLLIEKLSNDQDYKDFYKYTLAGGCYQYLGSLKIKNGQEITVNDRALFDKFVNKSANSYKIISEKYPEIKNLNNNDLKYVLEKSFAAFAALTLREVADCSYISLLGCAEFVTTTLQKAIFVTCLVVALAADIVAIYASAGANAGLLTLELAAELEFCTWVSTSIADTVCVSSVVTAVINCFTTERND